MAKEKLTPEQLEKLGDFFEKSLDEFMNELREKHQHIHDGNFEIAEVKFVIMRGKTAINFEFTSDINEGEGLVQTKHQKEFKL